jgi:hypothetical protein
LRSIIPAAPSRTRPATTQPPIDQIEAPRPASATVSAKSWFSAAFGSVPAAPPWCAGGTWPGCAGVRARVAAPTAGPALPSAYFVSIVSRSEPTVGSGPTASATSALFPGGRALPGMAIQVMAAAVSVTGVPPWIVASGVLSVRGSILGAQLSTDSG